MKMWINLLLKELRVYLVTSIVTFYVLSIPLLNFLPMDDREKYRIFFFDTISLALKIALIFSVVDSIILLFILDNKS